MKGVMTMRSHHLLLGIMSVTLAMNCGLATLDTNGSVALDNGKACAEDANCDDGNPCTVETCPDETKVCVVSTLGDVDAPAAAQTPANCKTIQCTGGTPVEEEDAQDVFNDDEDCTDDICSAGMPMNTPKSDGIACMVGQTPGTCSGGVCTP
jgi:hypothetical protein